MIVLLPTVWAIGLSQQLDQSQGLRSTPVLTYITIAEWWQWAHTRGWGQTKISEILTYAGNFELLHCDNEVVKAWGRLSGLAMKAGTTVPGNDCWIAACCVVHNLPLLTHDDVFKPLAALGLTLL